MITKHQAFRNIFAKFCVIQMNGFRAYETGVFLKDVHSIPVEFTLSGG